MSNYFKLCSDFKPTGDQPQAIENLVRGIEQDFPRQTLIGVTGSGKTFTMANVISRVNLPTLVISHNKTLAAQLYAELKSFFPDNRVEYFVSYYDYYQPEAYIPRTDTYIEKDSDINERIDRLRLAATASLLERRDVIIVSSVSCIYGLGSPGEYEEMLIPLRISEVYPRSTILKKLVDIQYHRNDTELKRSTFRVRGSVIDIMPAYQENVLRCELDVDDRLVNLSWRDAVTGKLLQNKNFEIIFPAKHFVTSLPRKQRAVETIKEELDERLNVLKKENRLLEAQRLEQRTFYDIEMITEIGYCSGIENYSRHFSGRPAGEPPYTLIDYYKDPFLVIIDESHVTLPQIRGMYNGDRARKKVLVEYGFRLPSALDNRPLRIEEFNKKVSRIVFVSATPGEYEKNESALVVEQLVRPTGILDPVIKIRPTEKQVDDLIREILKRTRRKERTLVTTLTKNMAEALSEYLLEKGIRVTYLHSGIDTIKRLEIITSLRRGDVDVLVGINLLREGLDLPEVSLVAILDADKAGFLRSETSLIQTMGRAARNQFGEVIMYADIHTTAMKNAVKTINRRRKIQIDYNKKNKITPESIKKSIQSLLPDEISSGEKVDPYTMNIRREIYSDMLDHLEGEMIIKKLTSEMEAAAQNLEFEKAAVLRDSIKDIEKKISPPKRKVKKR